MNVRLLATVTWACVLSISWLLILNVIVLDAMNIAFFVFFLTIAVLSSAIAVAGDKQ